MGDAGRALVDPLSGLSRTVGLGKEWDKVVDPLGIHNTYDPAGLFEKDGTPKVTLPNQPPPPPDLTDDVVKRAQDAARRRLSMSGAQNDTFLTGPLGTSGGQATAPASLATAPVGK